MVDDKNTVIVDLNSINNWKEQIKNINDQSLSDIESFSIEFNNLDSVMKGQVAEGLLKDVNEDLEKLKQTHKKMEYMTNFLDILKEETEVL